MHPNHPKPSQTIIEHTDYPVLPPSRGFLSAGNCSTFSISNQLGQRFHHLLQQSYGVIPQMDNSLWRIIKSWMRQPGSRPPSSKTRFSTINSMRAEVRRRMFRVIHKTQGSGGRPHNPSYESISPVLLNAWKHLGATNFS